MVKVLKVVFLTLAGGLLAIQLFPIDRSAPAITPEETLDAAVTVPP